MQDPNHHLWTSSKGLVEFCTCLFNGNLCILALIQYVHVEQTNSTWLREAEEHTSLIAECKILELEWPSMLCQSNTWSWVMEEIAGLLDVDWVEYAVVDDKEEARGMG